MISQHELKGMGVQIVLAFEVGLGIFADVVIDKGHGHHERDEVFVIVFDDFKELGFFIGR